MAYGTETDTIKGTTSLTEGIVKEPILVSKLLTQTYCEMCFSVEKNWTQ